ncbi:MAG: hypothetical protein JWN67_5038 [Actinomycetia bacterium]|nr:hypothetical protein [Actinomycetes bacterium]
MTTYAAQFDTGAGLAATYNAAAAGDKVAPGVKLIVKNTNGATRDLTLAPTVTAFGQTITSKVVTIPITTGERIIDVPLQGFAGSDGLVPLSWSATSGVTFAVLGAS